MLLSKRVLLLTNMFVFCLASLTLASDMIKIKVRDLEGRPIVGASVLTSWPGNVYVTDRRGEAKIEDAPKQRVSVVVRRIGYQTQGVIRNFTQRRQDISVVLHKPNVVVPKQTLEFVRQPVSLYGNRFWQLRRGDSEMRTKSYKQASASYSSVVRILGNDVFLDLTFTASEIGGDKTQFSGTESIRVYSAPWGKRIVGLKRTRFSRTETRLSQTGYEKKYGERHGSQRFPANRGKSIWANPVYTIDNRGKDADDIGMAGLLNFYVVLQ